MRADCYEPFVPGVVVLVGFSGVGKSYLASSFDQVDVIDTDDYIGKQYLGSSLKQLYFDLLPGADRTPIVLQIGAAEERFLKEWTPEPGSTTIVAAGPAIPSKVDLWKAFLDRIGATAIYLKAKPALVEERLFARYDTEIEAHAGMPNAQGWNLGILTKKVGETYVPLSKPEMQKNIAHYIGLNDPHYARYAAETYDCALLPIVDGTTIRRFRESVKSRLGL